MDIHVELAAETLFQIGPLPVTNSFLTMLIVMALLIIVGALIAQRAKVVPGRAQGTFELLVEFLLGLVEGTAGRQAGRRIFPLVGGIFIFIAFANYSGVLPGVGTVGIYESHAAEAEEHNTGSEGEATEPDEVTIPDASDGTADQVSGEASVEDEVIAEKSKPTLVPIFRAPNADLNMTLAMALVTFTVVQFAGVQAHGVIGRLKHMADPPFLFPIELIAEFSRIISLSARLFGNVFAGEILLGVMVALAAAVRVAIVPVLAPVIFIGLELLFGSIQALVFALLTMIYITLATSGGHDDAHDDAQHTAGAHGIGSVPAHAAD